MQEAYSSLATADEERGRQPGTQAESSTSSAPDSPGRSSHPDILSNTSSSSSSNSSSPRENSGLGGAPSGGAERGRRRVAGGARRIGVGVDAVGQESPERQARQARREAELETLLSGAAPPVGRLDEAAGRSDGSGSEGRGMLGESGAGERASSDAVDVESMDVSAFSSTDRGEKAGGEEENEVEDEAFWTTRDGFRHVLVTGAFLGLSYAIAMAVGDLGALLEVGGGHSSVSAVFFR